MVHGFEDTPGWCRVLGTPRGWHVALETPRGTDLLA